MTVAAMLGGLLPLAFARIDVDPAVASGPFLTTAIDIIGLVMYLFAAQFFLACLKKRKKPCWGGVRTARAGLFIVAGLVKGACGLRPTFGDGFLLHRRQPGPLRLPGCIGINVEEPAQDREILLVKDKGGSFPEAVVQAVL